ncbi:xanthine dehydrogenase family protein molybdopterin-binding subunit [Thermomonospora umbrina]|uniref:Xanthine dehydrogenase YagR molybdenum-binding subunit n=1 Tax=Thermomonospora umbrina TaxID=111806 RepID=A0A3D9STD8_9ACTN|nr:xanthine dehydrogenase family protein molybdopterin-binding subunit [Thermomonospora umbrina]REE95834.1 xanthine dehydrogenase YagR molybdenum-binding subunit [Thermomonospora umbrina]
MTETLRANEMGRPLERLDGHVKVTGEAVYAYEQPVTDPLYLHPVQSTIARGRITTFDASAAEAVEGVVAVLTHENAPRLAADDDKELWVLQDDRVHYRGQFIGVVVAESLEIARYAADLVRVEYDRWPHDVELRADRDDLYAPDVVNAGKETDTDSGDVDEALAHAPVVIDHTYTTPMEHNNPMEPHACIAIWDAENGGGLTLYDSTQGVYVVRRKLAPVLGLEPERIRVVSPHVGGGFGSKGTPHAHNVLACLAARVVGGRPVKLAVTRQQMFAVVGYRTPTIQRVRLGAGTDGRLVALAHDAIEQTSRINEFAEQSTTVSRMMYAAADRHTSHRLAALDVPPPFWMRAPGVFPGMYAAEVAMDELALACGLDPIELRVRNEPGTDPETGKPFSSRRLVECLREGARLFGWERRDPEPGTRLHDGWLEGTGVAAATYPRELMPGNHALIRYGSDGCYQVCIAAADIGTGTWTALTQIAADALEVPAKVIRLEIGDTDLPQATVAGGSSGLSSWGSAVVGAARAFRDRHGPRPEPGAEATGTVPDNPAAEKVALHSFGAQFAEVRVSADTGEVRVRRMLGVFSVGRVINARTARSQLIGGMTMGLSAALYEQSVVDPRFGHVIDHDLATYHIAANADVQDVDAVWLDEVDPFAGPMGARGIGEIGIVGAPAAIVNAVHHATGVRVRDLPVTPDKLVGRTGPDSRTAA